MSYIPHTDTEREAMLQTIGVARLEDLFTDIAQRLRFPDLNLPTAVSELELERELIQLAQSNTDLQQHACFLGAGVYHHYRPASVDEVLRRGEFYTAYTPYQPEASQGMLQAMFEYQSMICQLTGMEVSNASHYDGATALAEAVLLALNAAPGQRTNVILSPALHPQYRAVVKTYLQGSDARALGDQDLQADTSDVIGLMDDATAALIVQNPNFFGQFEPVQALADAAHQAGALLIVVPDPIALGRFQPPGAYGADIVAAEGQPLGIPPAFGGPHLGIFATRQALLRKIAGRLIGATVDTEGQRGYVLTLSTREQHIRREKATSNICTNAALTALAAAVYLATLGKSGLRQIAELCYHKSHYAAARIGQLSGFEINPQAPAKRFFKEFVLRLPRPAGEVNAVLRDEFGLIGGYDLSRDYPHLDNTMLIAVTEMNSKADIDHLIEGLRQAAA